MKPEEYIENVLKTESKDFAAINFRMQRAYAVRLDHASDGLVTEAGEFKDIIKKFKFYSKEIDRTNCIEELGDILWYIAVACDALQISLEEVMEKNVAKLKARYGDKFNAEGAINRDLDNERESLIGGGFLVHYTKDSECTFCGRKNLLTNNVTTRKKSVTCPTCIKEMQ